jgi:hypothetical protein
MFDIDPQTTKAVESVARSPFSAGLLGALVLAFRGGESSSWRERIVTSLSGCVLAGLLTPAAAEYFNLTTQAMQSGMAALIGLFGLNLFTAVSQWIKTADIADYIPWRKAKKDE